MPGEVLTWLERLSHGGDMSGKLLKGALVCGALVWGVVAQAAPLITPEEAARPAVSEPSVTRGISRGPGVSLVAPGADLGAVKSPFDFKVAFESRGGKSIDPASVQVVYLRAPAVDLTPRLKDGINGEGISLAGAEVPAGEHDIKVTVADVDGRKTSRVLHLVVAP